MAEPELVVLVDDDGGPIGSAPKATVHAADTPLHLAFSCYLFNSRGEMLMTRRALTKRSWPGVWTNSFCGHPAPGEDTVAAIRRRAAQELRAEVASIEPVLADFRYRAVDAAGVMENELCPVFSAMIVGDIDPAPAEVVEWAWIMPSTLLSAVEHAPFAFSPWLGMQLPRLVAAEALSEAGHG